MTREQAKNYLRCSGLSEEQIHAVISAFMSEDAVSRPNFDLRVRTAVGMVEEELTEDFKDGIKMVLELLKTEPSVAPAMERGSWVPVDDEPHEDYECDHCGRIVYCEGDVDFEFKYCPECGAEMWEGDEE